MPGAVAVVEQMLGHGIVDRDDRVSEGTLRRHGAQPDDARSRLLRAALDIGQHFSTALVQLADQIRAVVQGYLRSRVDYRIDVPVVAPGVFAPHREDRDLVVLDQRGRDVILGAQRVAGTECHTCATGTQYPDQIGRFRGHVQAGTDARAIEGLLVGKTRPELPQDGHLLPGPLDALDARFGEGRILDVGGRQCHRTCGLAWWRISLSATTV